MACQGQSISNRVVHVKSIIWWVCCPSWHDRMKTWIKKTVHSRPGFFESFIYIMHEGFDWWASFVMVVRHLRLAVHVSEKLCVWAEGRDFEIYLFTSFLLPGLAGVSSVMNSKPLVWMVDDISMTRRGVKSPDGTMSFFPTPIVPNSTSSSSVSSEYQDGPVESIHHCPFLTETTLRLSFS